MTERTTESVVEDLLETWEPLDTKKRVAAFQSLPAEDTDDFFLRLSSANQAELLSSLPVGQRRIWMRLLAPDDAADVLQEVPESKRAALLSTLDHTTHREVVSLLAYKEDAAGGLMNPRFARVRPDMVVDEAISYLRRQSEQVAAIYYAYALDNEQRLLGIVALRDLFSADRAKTVREIMRTKFVSASEELDQEALAKLFSEYHVMAIPVIDSAGRMKGIVTVDDLVEAVQEEATEDIQKIGGVEALDEPYLHIRFARMVKKRGSWLTVLFLGEMLTATAMSYFEKEIARAVVLALFVPLIISSGGNSGSQAATLVVRALAIRELRLRDWWRVVRREFEAGLCLGALLASIGFTRILLWQAVGHMYGPHYFLVALTVALSLIGVVLWGTLSGSMLPFVLRRLGLDPATASAPFVATLVDVTGLVIYFTVANIILRGTLL